MDPIYLYIKSPRDVQYTKELVWETPAMKTFDDAVLEAWSGGYEEKMKYLDEKYKEFRKAAENGLPERELKEKYKNIEELYRKYSLCVLRNTPLMDIYEESKVTLDREKQSVYRVNVIKEIFLLLAKDYLNYKKTSDEKYLEKIYETSYGYKYTIAKDKNKNNIDWDYKVKVIDTYKQPKSKNLPYHDYEEDVINNDNVFLRIRTPKNFKYNIEFGDIRKSGSPIQLNIYDPQYPANVAWNTLLRFGKYTGYKYNNTNKDKEQKELDKKIVWDIVYYLRLNQAVSVYNQKYKDSYGNEFSIFKYNPDETSRKSKWKQFKGSTIKEGFNEMNNSSAIQRRMITKMVKCINENKMKSAIQYLREAVECNIKQKIRISLSNKDK